MGLTRLGGITPGRLGIFAGSLSGQPATVQRGVAVEMERLGFGTLWYGESVGREASHAPSVAMRGHDYARPFSAMRDYLDRMGQAPWRGPEAQMPPIVLAALGPRMVGLAAERTAGAYPYFTTAEHIRQVREQVGLEPFLVSDMPVVLAAGRQEARAIGDAHTGRYLRLDNYRNNLLRIGWSEAELEPPGSDALFDAVVAWGDVAAIRERVNGLLSAGADQVALNLVTKDPTVPYLAELRTLAALNSPVGQRLQ